MGEGDRAWRLTRHWTDWTADEVAVVVAEYFLVLAQERADTPYVKAEHWRRVVEQTGGSNVQSSSSSSSRTCPRCSTSSAFHRSGAKVPELLTFVETGQAADPSVLSC